MAAGIIPAHASTARACRHATDQHLDHHPQHLPTSRAAPEQCTAIRCASRRQVFAGACMVAGLWLPHPSLAASDDPEDMSGSNSSATFTPSTSAESGAYDAYADTYDSLDDGWLAEQIGIPGLRRRLLASARGTVLEVGVGTGLNLPLYSRQSVTSLVGVDLSAGMLQQARQRAGAMGAAEWADLRQGDAAALPFADAQFDTVVDTFSLCVFDRPAAALAEMARVVKPFGRVLLLEHSRSSHTLLAQYQQMTSKTVAAASKGCVWDQDVISLARQAGLRPLHDELVLGGLIRLIEAQRA